MHLFRKLLVSLMVVAAVSALAVSTALAEGELLGELVSGDGYQGVIVEGPKARQLFKQCSRWAPDPPSRLWSVTSDQIAQMERDLVPFLMKYEYPYWQLHSRELEYSGERAHWRNLEIYARQYVGFIDGTEPRIYIDFNPMLEPMLRRESKIRQFDIEKELKLLRRYWSNWKTDVVVWCDGGPDHFGVVYDLQRHLFTSVAYNNAFDGGGAVFHVELSGLVEE